MDEIARQIVAAPASDLGTVLAKLEVAHHAIEGSDLYPDQRVTKAIAAIRADVERIVAR